VLLLIVVGAWRISGYGRIAVSSIPPRPGLNGFPNALRRKIAMDEFRVRYAIAPISGLAALSRLYQANGFIGEAAQCYRGLIRLDPENPRWPHFLGATLSDYGDMDSALPLLRRAASLAPGYIPARIHLADALLKSNQANAAAARYSAVLAISPENTYALLGLARCSLEANDWTSAQEYLKRATAADPTFGVAWALRVTVDEHFGNQAAADADEVQSKNGANFRDIPDPWTDDLWPDCYSPYLLRTAAAVASTAGDAKFALPLLRRAVLIGPSGAWNHRQLAELLRDSKQFPEAFTEMEKCVALDPGTAENWVDLMNLSRMMGNVAGAQRALADGLAHCPDSAALHLERGIELKQDGRYSEALADFQLVQRLQPDEPKNYIESAVIYIRLGELDKAAEELNAGIKVDPVNAELQCSLALYSINTADRAAAMTWLNRARANSRTPRERLSYLAWQFEERFGEVPW